MAAHGSASGFRGDYLTDRLVRVYSSLLFLILAVVIAVHEHSTDSMSCWAPAYFTEQQQVHTNHRCSQARGARLSFQQEDAASMVPSDDQGSLKEFNISAIRLFPVVLGLQALLFLLPWLMWKFLSSCLCNLNTIIRESPVSSQNQSVSDAASALASEIKSLLQSPWTIRAQGGYLLSLAFLLTRLLHWIVCFVQMIIISANFNINFGNFQLGQSLLQSSIDINESANVTEVASKSMDTDLFPRLVTCDFTIRQMGTVHPYSVMCSINTLETVETCLLIIWVWLVILLITVSISGLLQTLRTLLWFVGPHNYKKRYLPGLENEGKVSDAVGRFAREFLKPDVLFLLGMVEEKSSVVTSRAALRSLWEEYKNKLNIEAEEELTKNLKLM